MFGRIHTHTHSKFHTRTRYTKQTTARLQLHINRLNLSQVSMRSVESSATASSSFIDSLSMAPERRDQESGRVVESGVNLKKKIRKRAEQKRLRRSESSTSSSASSSRSTSKFIRSFLFIYRCKTGDGNARNMSTRFKNAPQLKF
jgi:hypothetical protein